MNIVNGHGHHCLDIKDTPERFLGIVSEYLHGDPVNRSSQVQKFLKVYNYVSIYGKGQKFASFLDTIDNTSEQRLIEDLSYFNKVAILLTDLHYMGAGKCNRAFEEQIEEGIKFKKLYPNRIYLFMMLDPNRPNLLELVEKYQSEMTGWKLYPTWYFVSDERLRPIFNKYPKPTIIHCTETSAVYWQGDRDKLKTDLGDDYKWYKSKKWNCQFYSHPKHIKMVGIEYPNINWCAAHLGGDTPDRQAYVLKMINEYPNLFADSSFTCRNRSGFIKLVDLMKTNWNIFMGTDYFMTNTEMKYEEQINIFNEVVPEEIKKTLNSNFEFFIKK
jgi:hypothetical protein